MELLGQFECNKDGKVVTIDQPKCVRVYNFPVSPCQQQHFKLLEDLNDEEVVDDWEELCEDDSVQSSDVDVTIPNRRGENFDLLQGYVPMEKGGNCIGFRKTRDKTAVFEWMARNFEKIRSRDEHRLFDLDFSLDNGVVRRVMKSYFDAEPFKIGVIFYRGTYHLFDFKKEEDPDERSNKHSFAGLRFEDFISRPINKTEREPSDGDRNNYADSVGCYNVIRFNFGKNRILLRGEVDCVIPGSSSARGKTSNVHDFIEVKTSKPYISEMKTGRWFTQCILMGVKHIVVGIKHERDDTIICDEIQAFTMDDLRRYSNEIWSEKECYRELEKFFDLVKENFTEESAQIVHMFTLKQGVFENMEKMNVSENLQLRGISEHFKKIDRIQKQLKDEGEI